MIFQIGAGLELLATAVHVVIDALEEGGGFFWLREPIAENDFGSLVFGFVERLVSLRIGSEPTGFDGNSGEESFGSGVDEDVRVFVVRVFVGFRVASFGSDDGGGIRAEIETAGYCFAKGLVIHDDVNGIQFLEADLEAEVGAAAGHESRDAPVAGGRMLGEEDSAASLGAEEEASAIAHGDYQAFGFLENGSGNGEVGTRHDLLQNVFGIDDRCGEFFAFGSGVR